MRNMGEIDGFTIKLMTKTMVMGTYRNCRLFAARQTHLGTDCYWGEATVSAENARLRLEIAMPNVSSFAEIILQLCELIDILRDESYLL